MTKQSGPEGHGRLDIGMAGLGVMGRNLALNIEEKGFSVAAYDPWPDPVARFVASAEGKKVEGFRDVGEFVRAIKRPRRVVILLKAGEVVDQAIATMRPFLEPGDLLVDAGNEHFETTERRTRELAASGIRHFGMGVSGGEARRAPRPEPDARRRPRRLRRAAPILDKIAAQHDDGPCVTTSGRAARALREDGAQRHRVRRHAADRRGLRRCCARWARQRQMAELFAEWNRGELESFLIEITARRSCGRRTTPRTRGSLVDQIVDATGMKGTGKWTVQDAAELGVPASRPSHSRRRGAHALGR
jgi:6-phosphogluconate dehydrogenase